MALDLLEREVIYALLLCFLLSFFLILITLKVLLGSWAGGILCGLLKELNAPDKFQLL